MSKTEVISKQHEAGFILTQELKKVEGELRDLKALTKQQQEQFKKIEDDVRAAEDAYTAKDEELKATQVQNIRFRGEITRLKANYEKAEYARVFNEAVINGIIKIMFGENKKLKVGELKEALEKLIEQRDMAIDAACEMSRKASKLRQEKRQLMFIVKSTLLGTKKDALYAKIMSKYQTWLDKRAAETRGKNK